MEKTKSEWFFNFVGGGWNSICATDKTNAIIEAKKLASKFGVKYIVIESSVRLKSENEDEYKMLMSNFY